MKITIGFLLSFVLVFATMAQSDPQAFEIVKKADEKTRGLSNRSEMSMTIERPSWSRTITMKSWNKGTEYSLILITGPAKDKGQVFLKRKKEMWNWVPAIERTIKIPPSMMMQGWMGSDFTNDDLVQQSSIVVDYHHTYLGKEEIRGLECHKIMFIPKPDAPVVWGKIISWISVEGIDLLKSEYYDEEGELVNIENAYDLKKMGDRTLPVRYEIIPVDKPGQKTVLEMKSVEFNVKIPDDFFSLQNMKRIQ